MRLRYLNYAQILCVDGDVASPISPVQSFFIGKTSASALMHIKRKKAYV